jgi:hypothetical protein
MPITINGSGTVTGLTPGGLPDGVITNPDLAADAVSRSKLDADTTAGVCKAWVNFNGTGTVAIRASYNVSSITDLGTGVYQANFANALADANYSAVASLDGTSVVTGAIFEVRSFLAASVGVRTMHPNFTNTDFLTITVAVFR